MYWFYSTYVYTTRSTIHHSVIEYRQSQHKKNHFRFPPLSVGDSACFQESLKVINISYKTLLKLLYSYIHILIWDILNVGFVFPLMRFYLKELMHYHYYFSALPAIWLENCNCKSSLAEFDISKNRIVRNTRQKFEIFTVFVPV